MATTNDLTVFFAARDSRCDERNADRGRHASITLEDDRRALCLSCADLDHPIFLPAGDAALPRRARKRSRLSAAIGADSWPLAPVAAVGHGVFRSFWSKI